MFDFLVACPTALAYYTTLSSTLAVSNLDKPKTALSPTTRTIMSQFFGDLPLARVVVVEDARWPWILAPSAALALELADIGAIALPPFIYWRGTFDQNSCDDLRTLMHELVHFRQHHTRGHVAYACEYGIRSTRGYAANPMEIEATRFVRENKWKLDQLCSASVVVPPAVGPSDLTWWWALAG